MSDSGIGAKIRTLREEQKMTLRELSEKCSIDISSLSKIEKGIYGVRDKNLSSIAQALKTSVEELKEGTGLFQIGVPTTIWALPLYYMIAEKEITAGATLAFYEKDVTTIVYLTNELENKIPETETTELMYAPTLIQHLLEGRFEAIFVPSQTYDDYKNDLLRVASITNTIKGGVELVVVSKYGSEELEKYPGKLKDSNENNLFVYLKDTIASNQIFDTFPDANYQEIEMNTLNAFEKEIKAIVNVNYQQFDNIIFAMWSPLIYKVSESIKKLSESIKEEKKLTNPPFHISFHRLDEFVESKAPLPFVKIDCIIRRNRKEVLKSNNSVFQAFIKDLNITIEKIEKLKQRNNRHPAIIKVFNLIDIDNNYREKAFETFKLINFELQFYPEWVF